MISATPGVASLLTQAKRAAQKRAQRTTTAHFLLVLWQSEIEDEVVRLLKDHGVTEGHLLSAIKIVGEEPASAIDISFERAHRFIRARGRMQLHSMDLLFAFVRDSRTAAYQCLQTMGVKLPALRSELEALLGVSVNSHRRIQGARSTSAPEGVRDLMGPGVRRPEPKTSSPVLSAMSSVPAPAREWCATRKRPRRRSYLGAVDMNVDAKQFPLLAALGRNLTALAREGAIDPVIGRDAEIEKAMDILARRRANNPLLVGPPGVGKTSVVEGLACFLAKHSDLNSVVIELSPGSLVSGTGLRGAVAERIRALAEEVKHFPRRAILFFDEIHAVLGGNGFPDDPAQELKALLARGELPCIGTTTEVEYKKYFERDPAFARRFSTIYVDEPSPEIAIQIVSEVAPRYEAHHGVRFHKRAIESAVKLSYRYIPERHLPDKAVAILDTTAARIKRRGGKVVEEAAVAAMISEQTRISVDRLLMRDQDKLLNLERELSERIVGHSHALGRIAEILRKGAAGFRGARPLATFLFLGSTGVGKTETAKAISDILFLGDAFTRLDMSEFSEPHAIAKLIGAPPGYIGHEEGGYLTESVRRRPYQLVLLDEIDKAHPEVLLSLLPLLDEGHLTDSRGRRVNFQNTVIVMTANFSIRPGTSVGRIGFGLDSPTSVDEQPAIQEARRRLPPEFWNRIDEPLYFAPLSREEVGTLCLGMLKGISRTIESAHGIRLIVSPSSIETLMLLGGFDRELGARPMRRTLSRYVEAPLASAVLKGDLKIGDTVHLSGEGDALRFRKQKLTSTTPSSTAAL